MISLLISFVFLGHSSVFSTDEFTTFYKVSYQAGADGVAHVSQEISLTNKLSNVYATQYSLNFQSAKIRNIQAFDGQGPIETEVKQTEDSTSIVLFFQQQVVGKDQTLTFNLTYDALDLVNKNGQVWEVLVPRLANASEIDQYQLELLVPLSFGTAAYISPQPVATTQEGENYVYQFSQSQLTNSGVSAAFGQFQVFNFILDYHLENDKLTPAYTEIALPPDTAFQKVYLQSLEPKPENVRVDEDGNWLAKYSLAGKEKLSIEATGKVKIFSQPQKNFPVPEADTLQKNLLEQKYWPINDPSISAKAKELKSIKEVYDFVVKHLSYDYERVEAGVERLGGLEALNQPDQATCMEFTDLFITLARAVGVPAREVNGYAYTTNPKLRPLSLVTDVLHSWPEYWDDEKKIWVPVDPTWEKTTGGVDFFDKTDLNHFAFALHGVDSQLPAPAGAYRDFQSETKNIQVNFGQFENLPESQPEVKFDLPETIFTGWKTKGQIVINNLGPTALYQPALEINGENLEVKTLSEPARQIVPPYGQLIIPLELVTQNWFKLGEAKINLALDSQKFSQSLKIKSLFWQLILPLVGLLFILGAALFFLIKLTVKKRSAKKELTNQSTK